MPCVRRARVMDGFSLYEEREIMDWKHSAENEAFRLEFRAWLEANVSEEVRGLGGGLSLTNVEVQCAWNAKLADAGYAAVGWPEEYGGRGAGPLEQMIVVEELDRIGAPGAVNVIGVANIAPSIMHWGTDEQKQRFLAPMLRGDEIWSQGFSEPDAGSDLAGLRTTAVLDGDHFVVNGQKIWNSLGKHAHWCELLVRTDAGSPRHAGISCLLVDLSHAGHRHPTPRHHHRRDRVRRDLLRRRPHPQGGAARPGQRGLAGRDDHPRL